MLVHKEKQFARTFPRMQTLSHPRGHRTTADAAIPAGYLLAGNVPSKSGTQILRVYPEFLTTTTAGDTGFVYPVGLAV